MLMQMDLRALDDPDFDNFKKKEAQIVCRVVFFSADLLARGIGGFAQGSETLEAACN